MVNDIVSYVDIEKPEYVKQATIVYGGSNPDMGIINMVIYVAAALLGAKIGDIVQVRLSMGLAKLKLISVDKHSCW
jgi:transcription elongation GreA/GreB family factor